jgi:3-oxoadipate CoA-transferase beta subunit
MSKTYTPRSPDEMAKRVVQDIHDGAYVNLGIGRPMLVANHLPADKDIILHSENGVLGMGAIATGRDADADYVNAGKQSITLRRGAALFNHADSFSMIKRQYQRWGVPWILQWAQSKSSS